MFRNFGSVFRFSFKNTVTRGYKVLTISMTLLLLIVPILIMVIGSSKNKEEKSAIDECKAQEIYIVNEISDKEVDFNSLNLIGEENYLNIKYTNFATVAEAMTAMKNANNREEIFILGFRIQNDKVNSYIIVPDEGINKKDAANYYDFMDKYAGPFIVSALGIDQKGVRQLMTSCEYDTYHADGFAEGKSIADTDENEKVEADGILKLFKSVLPFLCVMVLYVMILSYGGSTAQSIVMEKSSKLMDTMLVSVRPEALCMGKFLASVVAAIIQMVSWIAALICGFVIGTKMATSMHPNSHSKMLAFFKYMGSMGVFKVHNIIIGFVILMFGFILYASLSVIAGAVSSTREQVASASTLFIMPLIIAFFIVLYGGVLVNGEAPTWMFFVPFTSALIGPAYVALGATSIMTTLIMLGILVVLTVVLIILSGRLYKVMSLYKGNKIKVGKVMELLFTGKNNESKELNS
ncbi:ABC transporter permease [Eubacterium sp.]|uniref:ABC transporter permease n=1 Tax=Eubacterium sp. TaxID=142586 RepID=UPI00258674A5|nr:ABC transporter permease [Eubacterium sp.]MCR5368353.1 ABC transporter permease [Eubacterium sp.]